MTKKILTYSALSKFLSCRLSYKRRYIDKLVPKEKAEALMFGSVIHKCLEIWHNLANGVLAGVKVKEVLKASYPEFNVIGSSDSKNYARAFSMMWGYSGKYPLEDFEVIALEKQFQVPIINPDTGRCSKSFEIAGKIDGLIKLDGEYFILENKTASILNDTYKDRLWSDFQITLYAHYISEAMGIPIAGVIYNVLVKAKLKQKEGETEEEYLARYEEACFKNKTGDSNVQKKEPESNEAYLARLVAKYTEDSDKMFYREKIYFTDRRIEYIQRQVWQLTQALLEARKNGTYYCNTANCFKYNRACQYYPLCSSDDHPAVLNNYEVVEPHEELNDIPF